VYYECTVPGHGGEPIRVRWLEGYEFQQHVPHDVDFRILLTFVELYRTLISFVLYRLYTEENLVYPPPLDAELDERGESVGAFRLVEKAQAQGAQGKGVSKKEVKRAIKGIAAGVSGSAQDEDEDVEMDGETAEVAEEDFVERPSKNEAEVDDVAKGSLTTYSSLVATAGPSKAGSTSLLFAPYTFYLSRETSSRTWEFVIRAMGGRVVTAAQAPTLEGPVADGITHVIIDRPMTAERMREMQKGRKWVWIQPQWVADCVNRGKVLDAEEYAPGKLLPPHLSPWDGEGELERPWLDEISESGAALADAAGEGEDEEEGIEHDEQEDSEEEEEDEEAAEENTPEYPPALLAASLDPSNRTLLHAAELEAESRGVSHAAFRSQLKEATKANAPQAKTSKSASGKTAAAAAASGDDADLRKIMMSNKKAKLYEKMKYSNRERAEEVSWGAFRLPKSGSSCRCECTYEKWVADDQTEREARSQAQGHREEEGQGGEAGGQGVRERRSWGMTAIRPIRPDMTGDILIFLTRTACISVPLACHVVRPLATGCLCFTSRCGFGLGSCCIAQGTAADGGLAARNSTSTVSMAC
jgi:pescadillo protein